LAWIGIVAAALVAAFVVLVLADGRPSPGAPRGAESTGQTTDHHPTSHGPAATGSTSPNPTSPYPPTSGSTSTPAPGTSGPAVPADPGWPPSRIPTSLLPPSAASSGTDDPAGGVVAARSRVAGFVAALNANNPDRANTFLCRAMRGAFGADMLNGIAPGSVGVGGVTTTGGSGTAYITYEPTGGGDPEQSKFGLLVENGQWTVCQAQ
jgi:hypothetical protein